MLAQYGTRTTPALQDFWLLATIPRESSCDKANGFVGKPFFQALTALLSLAALFRRFIKRDF